MIRVEVDTERCIGSGACVFAAPAVFDQREEDGVVLLLTDSPSEQDEPAVQEAAMSCPASVIWVKTL